MSCELSGLRGFRKCLRGNRGDFREPLFDGAVVLGRQESRPPRQVPPRNEVWQRPFLCVQTLAHLQLGVSGILQFADPVVKRRRAGIPRAGPRLSFLRCENLGKPGVNDTGQPRPRYVVELILGDAEIGAGIIPELQPVIFFFASQLQLRIDAMQNGI